MRVLGDSISEGDVLLSNHPCAGGSHLPDLTVITPVHPGFYSLPGKVGHTVVHDSSPFVSLFVSCSTDYEIFFNTFCSTNL